MSRKLLELKHHVCDYTCMWNGIEDVYMQKSGEQVPDWFFFCLSGIGNNVYLRHDKEEIPRRIIVSDGRPQKIFGKIAEAIAMKYRAVEGRTLKYAMTSVKKQIDMGKPVVLGPLDMYHLPYLKMYHKFHIPIHYVLMTGYDEDKQCVYLYDCGKMELQEISYDQLEKAWQVPKTAIGDKNGFILFEFKDDLRSTFEIADLCLKKKAEEQLNAPVSFVGVKGIRKAADEFLSWEKELTTAGYRNSLRTFVEFLGTVPKLPNKILGIPESPDDKIQYQGCRDKMGAMLTELGEKYGCVEWSMAGTLFHQCGECFQQITDIIVEYLTDEKSQLETVPALLRNIADQEEKAYRLCLKVEER